MKIVLKSFLLVAILSIGMVACEFDEENELHINFKTDAGYTFDDATIAQDSALVIGIEAETEKSKDPIIRFNISESVNGKAPETVYTEDMSTANYNYDYQFVMTDSVSGNTHQYTFTITNKDGINKQVGLTLTVE